MHVGEIRPGVDARTLEEALEIAREIARALVVPDVMEGESLLDFERRVFDAWTNYEGFHGGNNSCDGGGAALLNRPTGKLSPGRGRLYWQEYCGGFDECWQALPGAKKRLDLDARFCETIRPSQREVQHEIPNCNMGGCGFPRCEWVGGLFLCEK